MASMRTCSAMPLSVHMLLPNKDFSKALKIDKGPCVFLAVNFQKRSAKDAGQS
jgi:hypothetical protein